MECKQSQVAEERASVLTDNDRITSSRHHLEQYAELYIPLYFGEAATYFLCLI